MVKISRFATALGLALTCAISVARVAALQDDDEERRELKQSHRFKEYTWVDQRAGDCHLSGVLTIFDHGYAIWTASTKTDHTSNADYWHETLEVLNPGGQRLFGFGQWDSPGMLVGSEYNWRKTDRFPAPLFDTAASANSSGSC